jgi:hypothetical protein
MRCNGRIIVSLTILFLIIGCGSPVNQNDKRLFVRAKDFTKLGVKVSSNGEKFKKWRDDGKVILRYDYRPPQVSTNEFAVSVLISIEKDHAIAQAEYQKQLAAVRDALSGTGITLDENNEFFHYGDESTYQTLIRNGLPVGVYFLMREKNRSYSLMIRGIEIRDASFLNDNLLPRLKLLMSYQP